MRSVFQKIKTTNGLKLIMVLAVLLMPILTFANGVSAEMPKIGGIRVEFFLFAIVLICVAIFHKHTFYVAVTGLIVILTYTLILNKDFSLFQHFFGNQETNPFLQQITDKETRVGEWGIILNLFGLLLGFAILAKILEESGVPAKLPNILPNNFMGP
ncbi:MAG: hypothetical protein GX259_06250, partial [Bacteroidales bacterium]|nr:hypothetical protein [Bacteroidales bacterium]